MCVPLQRGLLLAAGVDGLTGSLHPAPRLVEELPQAKYRGREIATRLILETGELTVAVTGSSSMTPRVKRRLIVEV